MCKPRGSLTNLRHRFGLAVVVVLGAFLIVASPALGQADGAVGPVVISEIFYNPDGPEEGHEFVELYNPRDAAVDLSGWELESAVDFAFPDGTMIAPGGYLAIARNADDFADVYGSTPEGAYGGALSNSGEVIELLDSQGQQVDEVGFSDRAPWPVSADGDGDSLQLTDAAADNNGPGAWLPGLPTPAERNQPSGGVVFDPQRGFYDGAVNVTLTASAPGAKIEYTLNGRNWTEYTGPIALSDNGAVRGVGARAVVGAITSLPETHSYVFGSDEEAPVIVRWGNGLAPADGDAAAGSFEFITPPSVPLPSVGANAGWRNNAAGINSGSSEKVYFRSEYGAGTLRADLFSDVGFGPVGPEPEIDQLALRNRQGDATHLKQSVSHDAFASLGFLAPHSRFVKFYENGSLAGVRQMQERPEGGFMEVYTGHDKALWDSTNWTTDNLLGDVKAAAKRSTLDAFKQIANVDHFIGYSLVDFLSADGDGWWKKNWRLTGPADPSLANGDDFAWHFFHWDEDDAWGSSSWDPSQTNRWSKQPYEGPEYLFVDLMDIPEFQYRWADAAECAYRNNGPLTQDRMYARVLSRADELAALGRANPGFLATMSTWVDDRTDFLFNEFVKSGIYPTADPVTLQPSGGELGDSIVSASAANGREIWYSTDGTDPRNLDGSRSATAIQANGTIPLGGGDHELIVRSYDPADPDVFQRWSAACPVAFSRALAPDTIVINEIHYNPLDEGLVGDPARVDGDQFEFVELHNIGDTEVSMSGWAFVDGIETELPLGTTIPAGGYFTLASDAGDFAERYGVAPDGEYGGKLNNGGESITLAAANGAVIDEVDFDDDDLWPASADGEGRSLALRSAAENNNDAAAWAAGNPTPGAQNLRLGDVDCSGDVDLADALRLARYLGGRQSPGECPLANPASGINLEGADFNEDGQINATDIRLILQCNVGRNEFC